MFWGRIANARMTCRSVENSLRVTFLEHHGAVSGPFERGCRRSMWIFSKSATILGL